MPVSAVRGCRGSSRRRIRQQNLVLTLQYKGYRSRNKPGSSGFCPGRQNCTEMHQLCLVVPFHPQISCSPAPRPIPLLSQEQAAQCGRASCRASLGPLPLPLLQLGVQPHPLLTDLLTPCVPSGCLGTGCASNRKLLPTLQRKSKATALPPAQPCSRQQGMQAAPLHFHPN